MSIGGRLARGGLVLVSLSVGGLVLWWGTVWVAADNADIRIGGFGEESSWEPHGIGWPALVLTFWWAFLAAATLLTGVICLIGAGCCAVRSAWRAMTANFRSDAATTL